MNQASVKSNQNQKKQQKMRAANVMETLKNVGDSVAPATNEVKNIVSSAVDSIKEDLIKKAPQDFVDQLLGIGGGGAGHISGEIGAGEQLNMRDVFSGKRKVVENEKKRVFHERVMHEEEIIMIQKRSNELRLQLKAIMEEVVVLASNTQDLGKEIQVAAMQAPVEPGVYHVIFFEKLLDFVRSFRKKIEEASIWLHVSNKRAEKKNFWARYKKHGAKYLLSGEHYASRSAG